MHFSRLRALFSIFFIASIDNCGYAMVFVLFPPLLLHPQYGFLPANPTLPEKLLAMGVLYAAFPIAQLVGAPIVGELADRYGRKKIFYLTIIGTIGAYLLTGIVLLAKSVFLLFIARFLTGLFSGNQGLCKASIADLSPNVKQRARNYGLLTVVWGLSFPLALILGGIFSDPSLYRYFNPSLPFYLAAILTMLSLLALILFFPKTIGKPHEGIEVHLLQGLKNIWFSLKMEKTKYFFLLVLFWTLGWAYSVTWYGVYVLKHFAVSQVATTVGLIIQGIGWTLGGSLIKPLLLKKLDIWKIAQLSYFLAAILLIVAAVMPSFSSFVLVYAFSAIPGAISLSSTFNLVSISAPGEMQGKAMGITQSLMSLGFFLVPILGGLSGMLSIYTFYPLSAFFLLIGLFIIFYAKGKVKEL